MKRMVETVKQIVNDDARLKLYLDDMRDPITDGWKIVRSFHEFKCALDEFDGFVVESISFDHDLGEDKSGYDAVCLIEQMVRDGDLVVKHMQCHSANPPGAKRINDAIRSIMWYQAKRYGKQLKTF